MHKIIYELKKANTKIKNNKYLKKSKIFINEIESLEEYTIGHKSYMLDNNKLNSDKYICNHNDLFIVPILEHVFILIKKINWLGGSVGRNGDLIGPTIYLRIELPELYMKKIITNHPKNYRVLNIYSDH